MKSSKSFLIISLILMSSLFPVMQARAQDSGNSQITPVVTVAPNLFAVGQFSTTFVCLSNGNPASTKPIQGGDTFKLTFDPSIGVVAAVVPPVMVNSSNLGAADFTASVGSVPNQVVIRYAGATKPFIAGDSICVKVTFTANNVIGSGKIAGESPSLNGDPGRYNPIDPKYTTISIVDFATGPQGPPGPGSVTSVSADSPLSVTNATTAPNISLGIVPVGKGGTGLSAAGASGNLLRSNGSAWTSGPLSASDIPPGNGNYIQNGASQQAGASFNISGNGTAGVFDAATQYNLGGARVLSTPAGGNLFLGHSAGQSNTTGGVNTFVGEFAGQSNTSGLFNSFLGTSTGASNTTGCCNNFFGNSAGFSNTQGYANSFFGGSTGYYNTTGYANAFFGDRAGQNNTTGSNNAFYGIDAGQGNRTGNFNTLVGTFADVVGSNLSYATAIGAGALVSTSNTVVLGRSADTVQVPGALDVTGGNILVGSPGQGIILKSPNGTTCRLLSIDNTGAMVLSAVACP